MIVAFKTHLSQQKSHYAKPFCIVALLHCLILFTHMSYAQTNTEDSNVNQNKTFSLPLLMQLPTATNKQKIWQQLIAHPVNSQQYYASNKQGQIYLIAHGTAGNTKANAQLLLDFKQLTLASNTVKTLNAFTLHPNFSLKDQQGFATFYTAHTEATNKKSTTKRIQERNAKLPVSFDGVITEWQLNLTNLNQVDLNHTREVLRITLPNANHGIKQLSFNPYTKSWNEDFALLYIALDSTDSLNQFPLYSGAILRINPKKFGMKSFTVPATNPFLKNNNIHNSFYLVGAQHIQQFIWPDKNTEQLLISHQYKNSKKAVNNAPKYQWLSFSQGGEDWRENTPEQVLYKSHKYLSNNQLLLYRGRNAPALHNKILLLQKNNNQWQLSSLDSSQQVSQSNTVPPQLEWPLHQVLAASNPLQFFTNEKAELIFFQQDTGAAFELFQNNIQQGDTDNNSSNAIIYILIIMMLAGSYWYMFYKIKIKKISAKAMVRRQYADINLDEEKQVLNFFKRHQKTIDKSIELHNIQQCQVLLGDNVIATIDGSVEQGFSDQQEQTLRDIFHREQTDKMVDGKIRRISIVISDNEQHSYIVCLYLRKGSDRITKKNYYQVIDDLIDWCWLIAQKINAENTGNRKEKPKVSAAEKSQLEHKLHNETPLHKQAAIIRPLTHQKDPQTNEPAINKQPEELADTTGYPEVQINNEKAVNAGLVDTELVNALDKLVRLKQLGFLSTEEFSQAKAKLLKNLFAE